MPLQTDLNSNNITGHTFLSFISYVINVVHFFFSICNNIEVLSELFYAVDRVWVFLEEYVHLASEFAQH